MPLDAKTGHFICPDHAGGGIRHGFLPEEPTGQARYEFICTADHVDDNTAADTESSFTSPIDGHRHHVVDAAEVDRFYGAKGKTAAAHA